MPSTRAWFEKLLPRRRERTVSYTPRAEHASDPDSQDSPDAPSTVDSPADPEPALGVDKEKLAPPKPNPTVHAQLAMIQADLVPGSAEQTALKGEVVTALKARLAEVMTVLENDADDEEMLTLAADLEEVIENAQNDIERD